MPIRSIMMLQQAQEKSNVDHNTQVKDNVNNAVKQQNQLSDKHYQDSIAQADKEKSAADTKNTTTCWFAIFLGPLIGTAIGNAIGGWASKGDSDDAAKLKKQAGVDDLEKQQADDHFDTVKKQLDENHKQLDDLGKFHRELRNDSWTGIQ